jgi:KAP-like P-loop domain-containing protein
VGAEPGATGESERWFVGREDVLETILDVVAKRGGYGLRALGTWGIGKTSLVDELRARAEDRAVVLHIKADKYEPSASSGGETPETLDVVRNWDSYARILTALIDCAPHTESWGTLAELVHTAQNEVTGVRGAEVLFQPKIEAAGDIEAKDEGRIASPTIYAEEPVERLEAEIAKQRGTLRDEFKETIDEAGSTSGAVILVDEFDRLRGHLVADWLLELITAPERIVVVIATRVFEDEPGTRALERTELQPFGDREVRLYLQHELGGEAVHEALVDRVLRFSGGLPQAIGMAADLIEQRRRTGGKLLLEDVSVDPSTATTDLLSTIVTEVPEKDVQQLLKEARFARRIDADLVHYLLCGSQYEKGSAEERKRADKALAALRGYSFVEEHQGGDDSLGRFRFHEYLMRATDATLNVDEEGLHAQLAAYYEQRLDDWEETQSAESSYMQLYKLESPEWQALTREWLYHLSRLERPDTREQAQLAFARVFLQTFWWYGCYVRYDFPEELVADWERLQPRDEDLTARLRELLESYPPGYDKLDKGNWQKVDQAMRTLHDALGLDARIPLDDKGLDDPRARKHLSNRRWVRALTSLFRAHSYRFRTGSGDLALPLFNDALKHLRAEEETSALAWTTFELAELKLELEDPEGAAGELRESARLLAAAVEEDDENQDYELLANLQRLRGDIAAAAGDWDVAVDATARAVLRAYAFLGEPQPPDPYTIAFYAEMRERAAQRLLQLRGTDTAAHEEQFLKQVEILRRPFGLEDAAGEGLESLLPPPPEKLGEAALEDETFATTARRALLQVQQDPSDAELAAEP